MLVQLFCHTVNEFFIPHHPLQKKIMMLTQCIFNTKSNLQRYSGKKTLVPKTKYDLAFQTQHLRNDVTTRQRILT